MPTVTANVAYRIPSHLLNEQHFLIGRQGPQVVRNHELELIAGRANDVHRGNDHVSRLLGVGERIAFLMLVNRLGKLVRTRLQLLDRVDQRAQMGRFYFGNADAGRLEIGDRLRNFGLVTKPLPARSSAWPFEA